MHNNIARISEIKIKKQLPFLRKERFEAALSGTHHTVFFSKNYVIRLRYNKSESLLRESKFLKKLNYLLIPKALYTGKVGTAIFMVENRLSGKGLDLVWKSLPESSKRSITEQIVEFMKYLRGQKRKYFYSVSTGKKYNYFLDYLTDSIDDKITAIKKYEKARKLLEVILAIIKNDRMKNLLQNKSKVTLVHGDLIIHNLLTDGKNLTGVLDWELALFGDPDYDLFRLFYYQECAKAYQEQGIDETFEADFMDRLIAIILKSNLIKNRRLFQEKYRFVRAIFYLNALYWAANSDNQEKNFNEIINLWNKKGGAKHFHT